ncbi:MAG: tetratricopeptide repeat protein, partial [Planctomycetota bacterium]
MTNRLITCMVLVGLLGVTSVVQAQVRYTPEGRYVGQARRPVAESDSLLAAYNSVVTLYEQQRYEEAIDLADELIDEDVNRKSPLLEPLYYYMGRAYMDNGELTDAVDTFEELLQRFPYTNFAGEVYQSEFDIAKRYLDGSYKFRLLGIPFSMAPTGRALIERLLERAPHSSFAPEGQFLVARYYFDSRQFSEAEMSFQQVTRLY